VSVTPKYQLFGFQLGVVSLAVHQSHVQCGKVLLRQFHKERSLPRQLHRLQSMQPTSNCQSARIKKRASLQEGSSGVAAQPSPLQSKYAVSARRR
jgi:hypothetical protein